MSQPIHISLSGIRAAKQQSDAVMQNIANAHTEGYERLELNQLAIFCGDSPGGVDISGVQSATNSFLNQELLHHTATCQYDAAIAEYYDRIEGLLGAPGEEDHISAYLANCLGGLNQLSVHPARASLRAGLLYQTGQLANKISDSAKQLEKLRLEADSDMRDALSGINGYIKQIYSINQKIGQIPEGSVEYATIKATLKQNVQKLAEYFDINCIYAEDGSAIIETTNGISLVSQNVLYQAKYNPIPNIDTILTDQPLEPFYITVVDSSGDDLNVDIVAVEGGRIYERTNTLHKSYISGLAAIRDQYIPQLLSQLDTFAHTLRHEVNKIHNSGNGFPPPSTLTGTRVVSYDQELGFTGSAMLTVVDDFGNQLAEVPALTIDFDRLNTGSGPGAANTRGIIQEINHFFGTNLYAKNRVEVGNVRDIKLVSSSNALELGDSFNLDLEVENFSASSAELTITGVTAVDSLGNDVLVSMQSSPYTIEAGDRFRTELGQPAITLASASGGVSYPYTITLQIQVVDGTQVYNSTIDYIIDNPVVDPINGLCNTRFDAQSADGDGSIVKPSVYSQYINAALVNDNGIPLPVGEASGRLVLSTSNKKWHIAMNQLDSKQATDLDAKTPTTDLSFSAFFGLNDFFVHTGIPSEAQEIKNSAYYLGVRADILQDSRFISAGVLRLKTQSNDPEAAPIYRYELSAGDSSTVRDMAELASMSVEFPANKVMPRMFTTLANYAGEMNTYKAMQVRQAKELAAQSESVLTALIEKSNDLNGVDINTELAKLVLFQQIFSSSAYAMKTAQDMFQILTQMMMR